VEVTVCARCFGNNRNWKDLLKPHFSVILFTSVIRFYTGGSGMSLSEIFGRPAEVSFENDFKKSGSLNVR
jgi:hypothetical protein